MALKEHTYKTTITWTGNRGTGTSAYGDYDRSHDITADGKPPIVASADPNFLGDPACWNPEELFLASLSSCHKLWYLGLCSHAGIVVTAYTDEAQGFMEEGGGKDGHFTRVVLHPKVTISAASDRELAEKIHHTAHEKCFIANSVNFPVDYDAETIIEA